MAVYGAAGTCPACPRPSDILGDHALCCASGGEMIARHNQVRDVIYDVAMEAGLNPTKEGHALIPNSLRRPADILIPRWAGPLDAALDVTVTHPLQAATRTGAATTPGHALTLAYTRKVSNAGELCQREGLAFVPLVAESLGGLHHTMVDQLRRLGRAVALHTGQDEGITTSHLASRVSLTLAKGLASMLVNRIPRHPNPETSGIE